jgi:catechol 2,3-dioxygenase-like lactoylglutathione lyase family enzyme
MKWGEGRFLPPQPHLCKKTIMLTSIVPKLPMRSKSATRNFYVTQLGFTNIGREDYDGYLLVKRDHVEIHFFEFSALDPKENYGQVYIRTNDIEALYQSMLDNKNTIHPAGHLQTKPWGQKEFSMLDPDNNLLTFGQPV